MAEDLHQLLANEFADDLVHAIEGMTGDQPKAVVRFGAAAAPEDCVAWRQRFSASSGSAWLVAADRTSSALGCRTLKAAGIEDEAPALARSTFGEILGQAFSMFATSLSGRTKKNWTCTEAGESPAPGSDGWSEIRLTFKDGESETVLVRFDDALMRALPPGEASLSEARQNERCVSAAAREPVNLKSRTLDLLMDVELPVSVSFGRAQLPLKEVVKLTTGSIVELNRTILEPVEVIVNNCVIARGEVVVIDGNLGVRIQQVISREERLRTLF